jgi:hypothetical protein
MRENKPLILDQVAVDALQDLYKDLLHQGRLKEEYPDMTGDWYADRISFINQNTIPSWEAKEKEKDVDAEEVNNPRYKPTIWAKNGDK